MENLLKLKMLKERMNGLTSLDLATQIKKNKISKEIQLLELKLKSQAIY